jgi:hypothetical protein
MGEYYGSSRMREQLTRMKGELDTLEQTIEDDMDAKYQEITSAQVDSDFDEIFGGHSTSEDGIFVGETVPLAVLGENGDYYYRRTDKFKSGGIASASSLTTSGTYYSGYKFTVTANVDVIGLRTKVVSASQSSPYVTITLSDENGIIAQTENVDVYNVDEDGWGVGYLDTPVTLIAGNVYYVEVQRLTGTLLYGNGARVIQSEYVLIDCGVYRSSIDTPASQRSLDINNVYIADIIYKKTLDYYYTFEQYLKNNGQWDEIRNYKIIVPAYENCIPYSNKESILCEAIAKDFTDSDLTWGTGDSPIQFANVTVSAYPSKQQDGSVYIPVKTSNVFASCDLGESNKSFTAYIVCKSGDTATTYSRIICNVLSPHATEAIMVYGGTDLNISSWSNDAATGINGKNYFVTAIRFNAVATGNKGFAVIKGNDGTYASLSKPTSNVGQYVVIGRSHLTDAAYPEPNDIYVKYCAVVDGADTDDAIMQNVMYLHSKFVAED